MTEFIKSLDLDNPSDELKSEAVRDAARDSVSAMDAEGVLASVVLTMGFSLHMKLTEIAQEVIADFPDEKKVDKAVNDMTAAAACFALGHAIVAYSAMKSVKTEGFLAILKGAHMLDASQELGKIMGEELFNVLSDAGEGKLNKTGIHNGTHVKTFITPRKKK